MEKIGEALVALPARRHRHPEYAPRASLKTSDQRRPAPPLAREHTSFSRDFEDRKLDGAFPDDREARTAEVFYAGDTNPLRRRPEAEGLSK